MKPDYCFIILESAPWANSPPLLESTILSKEPVHEHEKTKPSDPNLTIRHVKPMMSSPICEIFSRPHSPSHPVSLRERTERVEKKTGLPHDDHDGGHSRQPDHLIPSQVPSAFRPLITQGCLCFLGPALTPTSGAPYVPNGSMIWK